MSDAPPTDSPRCSRCGAALSGSAGGLCVRCLLAGALTPPEEETEAAEALASPANLLARRQFAGYELLGEIARGGMGVVFRARQKKPERVVALKVIAAGELATPRMVERFRTEAGAAARLDHPNIVPIYEVGHEGGWHFFSMRLIEGCTLAGKLRERGLPPEEAARLMIKIARAVQHAHERGVLHRDLKPNNILLDARGEPHLTDFGLAKMVESSVEMTLSNVALGTPAYMAPEQAAGGTRDVTVSVDVYGLGAVLYEMLAGRPPFEAANLHALMRKVAEEEPVAPSARLAKKSNQYSVISKSVGGPRTALGEATERRTLCGLMVQEQDRAAKIAALPLLTDLDAICLKCLEKEPAVRYRSAAELADDLESALRGETIVARPSTRTQRARKWLRRNPARAGLVVTAAVALVVITIGALLHSVRMDRARATAQRSAEAARRELVSSRLQEAARMAAAGDAFSGLPGLFAALHQADGAERGRVQERIHATVQLSPRLLRVRDLKGVPARFEFSPDGRRLGVTLRSGRALEWDLPRDELLADGAITSVPPLESAISPDGRWQARLLKNGPRVELKSTVGGTNVAAYSLPGPLFDMQFSPDSRWFALAAFRDQAAVYAAATGQPRGPRIAHESGANRARFSPDGALLVTAGFDYQLRIHRSVNQRLAAPVIQRASLIEAVAFSPDGRLLAVGDVDGAAQVWDLQTAARPFLVQGEFLRRVATTWDGKLLVLAGTDGALHVHDVLTGAEIGVPMPVPAALGQVSFDPRGRLLAVAGRRAGVRVFDFQTRQLVREIKDAGAATDDVAQVVFNPDGTAIATATPGGTAQRWSLADGRALGPAMERGGETFLLYWSADGRWISTGGGRSVNIWNAATGELLGVPLRVNRGEHIEECEFSPDGRHVLIAFSNSSIEPAAARIYELPSLRTFGPPLRHGDGVGEGGYSFDGRLIVTAGEDNTARLWHAGDGTPAAPELRHAGMVRSVAFRRDDAVLATGAADGMLRLWDVRRGELIAPPLEMGGTPGSLRLHDAKLPAVVGLGNGQTWTIPYTQAPAALEVLELLAECHSGRRLDTNGATQTLRPEELEKQFAAVRPAAPALTAWPDDPQRWHLERAAIYERRGDWFAAAFHLERLVAASPADARLESRLATARARLRR